MGKNSYLSKTETLSIVTQVNPTYEGKEIPLTVMTNEGEFDHAGQSLKISKPKEQKKSKKGLIKVK